MMIYLIKGECDHRDVYDDEGLIFCKICKCCIADLNEERSHASN